MWLYNNDPFTDEMINDYTGFVYIIENLLTGRQYVGQKLFWSPKIKTIKGKKKRIKVVSDYKDYFGSNDELKQHVIEHGPENFKREIIHLCNSKGEMNYRELVEQVDRRVLEKPDQYYNAYIGGRINRRHIKTIT
jgi:ribosomal protein L35